MALATNLTPGSIVLAGDLTGVAAAPELRVSGVVPGVYYSPSVVVDTKGRIIYAKSQWVLQGDATGMFNSNVLTPTGIAAGTYKYPTITVNSSGRITGIVSNPFNLAGDLSGGGTGSTIATTLTTRGGGTFTNPTITVNASGLVTHLTQGSDLSNIVELTTAAPNSNADLYFITAPMYNPLTVWLAFPTDPQLQSFDIVIKSRDASYVTDYSMQSVQYNGSRYASLCRDIDSTSSNGIRVTTSADGGWWKTTEPLFGSMDNSSRLSLGPNNNFYLFDFATSYVFISSDGVSWTPTIFNMPANMPANIAYYNVSEVRWNGSVFCFTASSDIDQIYPTTRFGTSINGIDWTYITPTDIHFKISNLLVNSNNLFCAVSALDASTMTSSDGYNWVLNPMVLITSFVRTASCVHNDIFVLIVYYPQPDRPVNDHVVLLSDNGQTWTRLSYPVMNGDSIVSVASNGSLLCAVNTTSAQIAYRILVSSNGGVQWEQRSLPFGMRNPLVTSANGIFFISDQGLTSSGFENPDERPVMCLSSTDCINWTVLANPSPIQTDIIPAPGFKFSNSQNGTRQVLTCTKSENEFFCTYR